MLLSSLHSITIHFPGVFPGRTATQGGVCFPELWLPVCLFQQEQQEQRERRAPAVRVGVQAGLFFFYFPSTPFPLTAPRRFVLGKPSFSRGSACVIGTFYWCLFFLAFIRPRHCQPDGGGASLCVSKTGFIRRRHV